MDPSKKYAASFSESGPTFDSYSGASPYAQSFPASSDMAGRTDSRPGTGDAYPGGRGGVAVRLVPGGPPAAPGDGGTTTEAAADGAGGKKPKRSGSWFGRQKKEKVEVIDPWNIPEEEPGFWDDGPGGTGFYFAAHEDTGVPVTYDESGVCFYKEPAIGGLLPYDPLTTVVGQPKGILKDADDGRTKFERTESQGSMGSLTSEEDLYMLEHPDSMLVRRRKARIERREKGEVLRPKWKEWIYVVCT